MGYHPLKNFTAHDDAWPTHTEVLPRLQSQFPKLIPGPHSRLTQKDGLTAIEAAQEALELLTLDVDIIISPHKPFILIQVIVMHVLKHHEGLLLGRV